MQDAAPQEAGAAPGQALSQDTWLSCYFRKFKGAGAASMARPPWREHPYSFAGSFVGIGSLAVLDGRERSVVTLVPAFGAAAVLSFSAWKAPLAQPRNVIVGNTIGGLVGVAVHEFFLAMHVETFQAMQNALAVSLTIVCQERTSSVFPPGGATALVYTTVIGVQHLGFIYMLCPAFLGAVFMTIVALFANNVSETRSYPQTWGWGCLAWQKIAARFSPAASPQEGTEAADPQESTEPPGALGAFVAKLKGKGSDVMPVPTWAHTGWSFMGSFVGIFILSTIDAHVFSHFPQALLELAVAPFGALAVLLFSACEMPLAQPRNAIGGNLIGALVGVLVWKLFVPLGGTPSSEALFLACALAVSTTIVLQELTGTVHPPGGAATLLFVTMPPFQAMGFQYIVCPVLLGSLIMVGTALVINNLSASRSYPRTWGCSGPDAAARAPGNKSGGDGGKASRAYRASDSVCERREGDSVAPGADRAAASV